MNVCHSLKLVDYLFMMCMNYLQCHLLHYHRFDAIRGKKYRIISGSFYCDITGTFSGAIEAQFNCPNQIDVTKNVRRQLHPHHCLVATYSISVIS